LIADRITDGRTEMLMIQYGNFSECSIKN